MNCGCNNLLVYWLLMLMHVSIVVAPALLPEVNKDNRRLTTFIA